MPGQMCSRGNHLQSHKLSILTQEACRRVNNFSLALPWELKLAEINCLMVQMRWGGYSQQTREIVARRVVGKLEMNEFNRIHLGRPLYRTKEERRENDKPDKSTWFRSQGATTTLMVPSTAGSELAKRLRLVVNTTTGPRGTSVKVVEKPGKPIMAGSSSNNPF